MSSQRDRTTLPPSGRSKWLASAAWAAKAAALFVLMPTLAMAYTVSGNAGKDAWYATATVAGLTASVDWEGNFTIPNVPGGTQTLTITKLGCTFSPASVTGTLSADISLNFVPTCTKNLSISGNVGSAGDGVRVTAVNGSWDGSPSMNTPANGNFSFGGLSAGSYRIVPAKTGCTFSPASITKYLSSANATGVNFTATCTTPYYSLSGTVSSKAPRASVTAKRTSPSPSEISIAASSSGTYSFPSLLSGTYTVTAEKRGCSFSPASLSVPLTKNTTSQNFTATCVPMYSISGSLGTQGAGLRVDAKNASGQIWSDSTSSTGAYSITDLPAGTYTVSAYKPWCTMPPLTVTLTSANAAGKDLTITCKYYVSGSVGAAARGATIAASSSTGSSSVTASDTGAYHLPNLVAPGPYTVTPSKPGCTFSPANLSLTLSGNQLDKNFAASCAYSVSGNAGTDGAGAVLTARSAAGATKTVTVPTSGLYTLAGLTPGAWTLTPTKAGCAFAPASIAGDVWSNLADLNFTCTYSVSGNVGARAAGATITAGGKSATADAAGNYILQGLARGSYTLTATKTGCTFSPPSYIRTLTANMTGANFTPSCTSTVSGTVGPAAAGATLSIGSLSTTADANGNFALAGVPNGTFTLTPAKASCAFIPASHTATVSGDIAGANFTATCWTTPINADDAPLRWYDVVTNVVDFDMPYTGLANKVIEIDMANLHRVKVYDDDPYWFKYYRGFFGDTPGSYQGEPSLKQMFSPNIATCSGVHDDIFRRHGVLGTPIRTYQYCNGLNDAVSGTSIGTWWAVTHNATDIGPSQMIGLGCWLNPSYGLCYRIPNSGSGNMGVALAGIWTGFQPYTVDYGYHPYGCNGCNTGTMSRDVYGGEVAPDGWALVPLYPNVEGPGPVGLVYVKPSQGPNSAWQPDYSGNSGPYPKDTMVNIGWGDARQNMNTYLYSGLNPGASFGLGDDISGSDSVAEGFYVIGRNGIGDWTRSEKIDIDTAYTYIKDGRSLVINGSGNSFKSGMKSIEEMAEKVVAANNQTFTVAYYMPQGAGPIHYLASTNASMRNALTTVFTRARDQGTRVNVVTHSWASYVTATSCNGVCDTVNHIAFAAATMPSLMDRLGTGYSQWKGTGTTVVGRRDPLSSWTDMGSRAGPANPRINTIQIGASHSVTSMMGAMPTTTFVNTLWKN